MSDSRLDLLLSDETTRGIPVVMMSSTVLEDAEVQATRAPTGLLGKLPPRENDRRGGEKGA